MGIIFRTHLSGSFEHQKGPSLMEALWGKQRYEAGFKFGTIRCLSIQRLTPVFLWLKAAFPF